MSGASRRAIVRSRVRGAGGVHRLDLEAPQVSFRRGVGLARQAARTRWADERHEPHCSEGRSSGAIERRAGGQPATISWSQVGSSPGSSGRARTVKRLSPSDGPDRHAACEALSSANHVAASSPSTTPQRVPSPKTGTSSPKAAGSSSVGQSRTTLGQLPALDRLAGHVADVQAERRRARTAASPRSPRRRPAPRCRSSSARRGAG